MTPQQLVAEGFAVCEVAHVREDGACSCRFSLDCPSPGKHPVGKNWKTSAIRRWGSMRRLPAFVTLAPVTSYGLIPMPGSGLMVIDRDDPTVGLPMPETFEVHRPSADGRRGHYYFRLAPTISEDMVPRVFAGGEVRVGGSGHVVGPGSRHSSGDVYAGNDLPIAEATQDLVDALSALPPLRRDGTMWDGEAVGAGERHAWLAGQARRLRGQGLNADAIADGLRELNEEFCAPPLTEKAAEFDRLAEWAEKNVEPDRVVSITRSKRDPYKKAWDALRNGGSR